MKLILGDCLDKLKELEDNSVDSIVTDPPYGLSFMGKNWDYDVPSQEIWEECLRVLKPGGHLLAFAGSRTYHRMAVKIEDAGFEIRDQIMWVYGCLTEDTEILTKEGWKHYHKITKDDIYSKDEILVYDTENDIYKWEKPERWYVYQVNEDTVYRIRGNQTDQIVSKDHNCLVERNGNLVFAKSQDLGDMERVPIVQNDFSYIDALPCGQKYTTDLATITKETYSGVIFCPNTSTGAFVARRNGKVFITGNSGFPKSMNIGKKLLSLIEHELQKQNQTDIEWK